MTSIIRRARERLPTRPQIVGAAHDLIARFGYGRVSVRQLAGAGRHAPATTLVHLRDGIALVRGLTAEADRKPAQVVPVAGRIAGPIPEKTR